MLTVPQFKEIYSRYQSSGLTIRSFCQNEGMYEARFYYWRKRLQRFLPGDIGFIPVRIEESNTGLSHAGLTSHNLSVFSSSDTACSFEITYSDGTRLKITGGINHETVKSFVLLKR